MSSGEPATSLDTPRAKRRRRPSKPVQVALALCAVALLGWLGYLLLAGNFYTVEPGILFRSAQPGAAQLERYARAHQLQSVLNLRGAHPGADWYVQEVGAASELGLVHFDLRFSATQEATLEQMDELVETMRSAPKPLLIHCMGGADRTGLAVALYRFAIRREPSAQAGAGLSAVYGHLPYLGSQTGAMDRSFARYVAARDAGR